MKLNRWILVSSLFALVSCAPKSDFQNNEVLQTENTAGIIDGTTVSVRLSKAAKSVVYIEFLDRKQEVVSYCTATLIASNFVLTAAHCFDTTLIGSWQSFNVVFENRFKENGNRLNRRGVDFKTHPKYDSLSKNPRLYDHDIAIAMFSGGIPSGFNTVSIDTDVNATYSETEVYAYGFGRVDDYKGDISDFGTGGAGYLRRGTMQINDNYNETEDRYFIASRSRTFVCQGDSGGPQFYDKKNVLKVIGVNSASAGDRLTNGKSLCRGKTQVTKVAPFSSWIINEQNYMLKFNQ